MIAEFALLEPQYSDVRRRSDGEVSKLLLLDLARGIPGGSPDHLVERHAQGQELAHDGHQSLAPATMESVLRSVEIESGSNPSLMIGTATRQVKLAAAVADVEDHAALAALEQSRDWRARRGPARRAARNTRACRCLRGGASSSGVPPATSPERRGRKSTMTGILAIVPASTARSTATKSRPM